MTTTPEKLTCRFCPKEIVNEYLQLCDYHLRRGYMRLTQDERFYSRFQKGAGCWNWTGSKNSWGYGCIRYNQKNDGAHRVAWILKYGKIPKGLCVLHRCDNPACVRPDHLFLGTQMDNMQDRKKKGKYNVPEMAICKRGHKINEKSDLYITAGQSNCRKCYRWRYHLYYKGRKASSGVRYFETRKRNKLNREQIFELQSLRREKTTIGVGKLFGINSGTVSRINRGESYKSYFKEFCHGKV